MKHGKEGTTHWPCDNRLKREDYQVACCMCSPHTGCGDDVLGTVDTALRDKIAVKIAQLGKELELLNLLKRSDGSDFFYNLLPAQSDSEHFYRQKYRFLTAQIEVLAEVIR